jgi:hypothetical protein
VNRTKEGVPVLCLESPDEKAVVEFLQHRTSVILTMENGNLLVEVQTMRPGESYVWDTTEVLIPCYGTKP